MEINGPFSAITAAAARAALGALGKLDDISQNLTALAGRVLRSQADRLNDRPASLADFPGFDPTGKTSSSSALAAWLSATSKTGGTLLIREQDLTVLDQDFVVNRGQRILGCFNPRFEVGASGTSSAYAAAGGLRLANGAKCRLDNGGILQNLLIYRQGLQFDVAQDLNTWVNTAVVIGYGNDQALLDVMILGFNTAVAPLNPRGLNGAGRVVIDGLYMDSINCLKLVGSYDTSFIDRVRGFPFVTLGYAGTPASGESYDPRKDRRPGVGMQWLDRSDGTKIGRVEMFGYQTGFDTNTASWQAAQLVADYPTTTTYNSGGSGTVGFNFRADTDNSSGSARATDVDPSALGLLQAWSMERGIVYSGNPGRRMSISVAQIFNVYGDALTVSGGGIDIASLQTRLTTGTPIVFSKSPDTQSRIYANVSQFGAARNSNSTTNVPAVKLPANSSGRLLDVRVVTDQPAGAMMYDNPPNHEFLASADPLNLPGSGGRDQDTFVITGTAGSAGMYGHAGARRVRLYARDGFTLFPGNYAGGYNVPSGGLAIPAAGSVVLDYNGSTNRWDVIGKSF